MKKKLDTPSATLNVTNTVLRGIIVTMPIYMYISYCDKKGALGKQ